MAFQEQITFAREFLANLRPVGAVVPISTYAAAALGSELTRWRSPKRVLEVGAGTGAMPLTTANAASCGGRSFWASCRGQNNQLT